jgi:hypothetical protein
MPDRNVMIRIIAQVTHVARTVWLQLVAFMSAIRTIIQYEWLIRVAIPLLYIRLGRRVADAPTTPQALGPLQREVRSLQQAGKASRSLKEAPQIHVDGVPNCERRQLRDAKAAGVFIWNPLHYLKLTRAHYRLGKAAFESYGRKAVPPDLEGQFRDVLNRRRQLLSPVGAYENLVCKSLSRPRLAFAVMATAAAGLMLVWWLRGSSPSNEGDLQAQARVGNEPASTFHFRPHVLGSTGERSPWRIESENGLNDYAHLFDRAVATALGEESTLFLGRTYRGVELCTPFATLENADDKWNFPIYRDRAGLIRLPPPSEESVRNNAKLADTRVIVDRSSRRVVAVIAVMDSTELESMVSELVREFGKTTHEVETRRTVGPGPRVRRDTTVAYTFPQTIVRVFGMDVVRPEYSSNCTDVWVVDREYVERNLRAHANAFMQVCKWIKEVQSMAGDGDGIRASIVPGLVDTRIVRSDEEKAVICVDPAVEKEVERIKNHNATATRRNDLLSPPERLVAGAATLEADGTVVVAMPGNSSTNGYDCLWVPGHEVNQHCIIYTLSDMVWKVSSVIAQSEFPPVTEQISVIDPQADNPLAQWRDTDTVRQQVAGAYQVTKGRRHEWVDGHGWIVRVTPRGSISVQKNLR